MTHKKVMKVTKDDLELDTVPRYKLLMGDSYDCKRSNVGSGPCTVCTQPKSDNLAVQSN